MNSFQNFNYNIDNQNNNINYYSDSNSDNENGSDYDSSDGSLIDNDENEFYNHDNASEQSRMPSEVNHAYNTLANDIEEFEKDIHATITDNLKVSNIDNKTNTLKTQKVKKDILFYIDSKDRILNGDNQTFNFQITMNEQNVPGVSALSGLSNIVSIELLSVMIPNFYIDLRETLFLHKEGILSSYTSMENSNNLRTLRLADNRYIFMSIDRYNNDLYIGTNTAFRSKSFVLKLDETEETTIKNSGNYILNDGNVVEVGNINNNILANTDKNMLLFKPIGKSSIDFRASNNHIANFNISFKSTQNKTFEYLNDTLTISSIIFPSDSNKKIRIMFSKFFSAEEYSLGDRIIIKKNTLEFSSSLTYDIETFKLFLERDEGHSIVQHYGDSEGNPVMGTKLFKGFFIPANFNYTNMSNTATNDIFSVFDFGIPNGTMLEMNNSLNTSNKLVSLQRQILISLKINTENSVIITNSSSI